MGLPGFPPAGAVKPEPGLRKRKKARAPKKMDSKKRRLSQSADRFAKNAREKTTVAWHKSCRWFPHRPQNADRFKNSLRFRRKFLVWTVS